MTRPRLWLLAVVLVAGCGDDTTTGMDMATTGDMAVPDLATGASVARGEELVKHLLLCGQCHTTPDATTGLPSTSPTDYLAGGKKFTIAGAPDAGSITVYAPNLTPDNATGVGTWSLSQLVDAMKVGVDDQGNPLWPTMPYQRFANLNDDDATSIAMYLKSLPPQSHTVPEDSSHPAMAATVFSYATIPHTTLAATDPNFASAERGRYLANLGCLNCHTVSGGPPTGVDATKAYAGGKSFGGGVKSSNLTPDNATGLGTWTTTDIIDTLKTDKEKGTGRMLQAPMPGGTGIDQVGGLFDNDLTDLANYIHTLPPVVNGPFGPPDM